MTVGDPSGVNAGERTDSHVRIRPTDRERMTPPRSGFNSIFNRREWPPRTAHSGLMTVSNVTLRNDDVLATSPTWREVLRTEAEAFLNEFPSWRIGARRLGDFRSNASERSLLRVDLTPRFHEDGQEDTIAVAARDGSPREVSREGEISFRATRRVCTKCKLRSRERTPSDICAPVPRLSRFLFRARIAR